MGDILNFKDFVGQEKIKGMLQKSIEEEKLSHAYSFEGPVGMGKFTLAMAFANAALCERGAGDACGQCLSCKKVVSGNHPDFIIVSPQKASIGIDEIRKLQEHIIIKPISSDRKVYIIDQADKMTAQAQNCLLKTLEEPPAEAMLILCVSNSNLMLKTIQSRCTSINFKIYSEDEIKLIVNKNIKGKIQKLEYAAAFSQGVPGKAFSIISDEFLDLREEVFEVIEGIRESGFEELYRIASFFEKKKDIYEDVFDIMTTWYRDLVLYRYLKDENVLINHDKKGIILNSILENDNTDLVRLIGIVQETRKQIKMNVNYQMAIDYMLLSLWEVFNGKSSRSAV